MGFLSPEKSGYHILNLSKFSSISHHSLAWMRICAERSRADWDWELWMAVLEIAVDEKGILMETFLIRKNHSATQNPFSFWCRTPPLFFWMIHSPLLSGWNKFISFNSCLLAFPCWDFSPGSTTSLPFHWSGHCLLPQGTHGVARFGHFLPTKSSTAFSSTPTQHVPLSALDDLAWDPSHFFGSCRVWTRPTQLSHRELP